MKKFFPLMALCSFLITGCQGTGDILALTNGGLIQNTIVKFVQQEAVEIPGEFPFSISANPEDDANAAAQILADDVTANAQITKIKLTKKLKKNVSLVNTNTGAKVKKSESFGVTATVKSATNIDGTISGFIGVTVNNMTAQAKSRLIKASEKPNNKGFTKLSKASFVVITDDLAQSTVDAIIAGDPASQVISKLKGNKVITKTFFVPFI